MIARNDWGGAAEVTRRIEDAGERKEPYVVHEKKMRELRRRVLKNIYERENGPYLGPYFYAPISEMDNIVSNVVAILSSKDLVALGW